MITVNQGVRGGKLVELKKTVDEAVQSCPTVQQVFVAMRTENPVSMAARDVALEEVREQQGWGKENLPLHFNHGIFVQEMLKEDVVCEPEAMDSEDVLFLLYTSGSTGKPKGLVHTQAGYLLYAALTHRVRSGKKPHFRTEGDVFLKHGRLMSPVCLQLPGRGCVWLRG